MIVAGGFFGCQFMPLRQPFLEKKGQIPGFWTPCLE
jgi:hypothetical protein